MSTQEQTHTVSGVKVGTKGNQIAKDVSLTFDFTDVELDEIVALASRSLTIKWQSQVKQGNQPAPSDGDEVRVVVSDLLDSRRTVQSLGQKTAASLIKQVESGTITRAEAKKHLMDLLEE